MYGQAAKGRDIDATGQRLAVSNAALRQRIADASNEIAQAQNPAWLEEQARKIGYVKPGEKVYVLVTPGTTPLPAGGGVNANLPAYSASPNAATPVPAPQASASASAAPTPRIFTVPTSAPGH